MTATPRLAFPSPAKPGLHRSSTAWAEVEFDPSLRSAGPLPPPVTRTRNGSIPLNPLHPDGPVAASALWLDFSLNGRPSNSTSTSTSIATSRSEAHFQVGDPNEGSMQVVSPFKSSGGASPYTDLHRRAMGSPSDSNPVSTPPHSTASYRSIQITSSPVRPLRSPSRRSASLPLSAQPGSPKRTPSAGHLGTSSSSSSFRRGASFTPVNKLVNVEHSGARSGRTSLPLSIANTGTLHTSVGRSLRPSNVRAPRSPGASPPISARPSVHWSGDTLNSSDALQRLSSDSTIGGLSSSFSAKGADLSADAATVVHPLKPALAHSVAVQTDANPHELPKPFGSGLTSTVGLHASPVASSSVHKDALQNVGASSVNGPGPLPAMPRPQKGSLSVTIDPVPVQGEAISSPRAADHRALRTKVTVSHNSVAARNEKMLRQVVRHKSSSPPRHSRQAATKDNIRASPTHNNGILPRPHRANRLQNATEGAPVSPKPSGPANQRSRSAPTPSRQEAGIRQESPAARPFPERKHPAGASPQPPRSINPRGKSASLDLRVKDQDLEDSIASRVANLNEIGKSYFLLGDYHAAAVSHYQAWKFGQELLPDSSLVSLTGMALAYTKLGDSKPALKAYEQILLLLETAHEDKEGQQALTIQMLLGAGAAHHQLGQYHKALGCLERAMGMAMANKPGMDLMTTYIMMGNTSVRLQALPEAMQYYHSALDCAVELNDMRIKSRAYCGFGIVHAGQGEFQTAVDLMRMAFAIHEKGGLRPPSMWDSVADEELLALAHQAVHTTPGNAPEQELGQSAHAHLWGIIALLLDDPSTFSVASSIPEGLSGTVCEALVASYIAVHTDVGKSSRYAPYAHHYCLQALMTLLHRPALHPLVPLDKAADAILTCLALKAPSMPGSIHESYIMANKMIQEMVNECKHGTDVLDIFLHSPHISVVLDSLPRKQRASGNEQLRQSNSILSALSVLTEQDIILSEEEVASTGEHDSVQASKMVHAICEVANNILRCDTPAPGELPLLAHSLNILAGCAKRFYDVHSILLAELDMDGLQCYTSGKLATSSAVTSQALQLQALLVSLQSRTSKRDGLNVGASPPPPLELFEG